MLKELESLRSYARELKGRSGYVLKPSRLDPRKRRWQKVPQSAGATKRGKASFDLAAYFGPAATPEQTLRKAREVWDKHGVHEGQQRWILDSVLREVSDAHRLREAATFLWARNDDWLETGYYALDRLGVGDSDEQHELLDRWLTEAEPVSAQGRVVLVTSPHRLERILGEGRYVPATAVPELDWSSQGDQEYTQARLEVEEMWHIDHDDPLKNPIYGTFAAFSPDMRYGVAWDDDLTSYGSVGIVLKPETLLRSSLMLGDSLNNGGLYNPMTYHEGVGVALAGTKAYAEDLRDEYLSRPSRMTFVSYPEAQVFGGVSFEDFEGIYPLERPDDRLLKLAESYKLPVVGSRKLDFSNVELVESRMEPWLKRVRPDLFGLADEEE